MLSKGWKGEIVGYFCHGGGSNWLSAVLGIPDMNLHNWHSLHIYLDIPHLKVDDANATPMYLFVYIRTLAYINYESFTSPREWRVTLVRLVNKLWVVPLHKVLMARRMHCKPCNAAK